VVTAFIQPDYLSLKSLTGTLPIVLGDPRKISPEKRAQIKKVVRLDAAGAVNFTISHYFINIIFFTA
jgi:hypothetical protein